MKPQDLMDILQKVRDGGLSIEEAYTSLRDLPYEDLEFAKIDHHRGLRLGFPEIIFCPGKTTAQIIEIMEHMLAHHSAVIATRVPDGLFAQVQTRFPQAQHHELARIITINVEIGPGRGPLIAVVTAGTADIPVAEEAALTAEILGSPVLRVYDVGVAGIHRLLDKTRELAKASVLIVVAGMDGALPSVVGGLFGKPVIAVPTSVGYGANFNGLAALLTMINSCAVGVGVVNIDNGFGAGVLGHMITRVGAEK